MIVETKAFTKRLQALWDDESYRTLQSHLLKNPTAGTVIRGTGGLRKLRWAGSGRGKRGGTRLIYFSHPASSRLVMLFLFAKNESDDLTVEQRESLKRVIQSEYP